MSLSKIAITRPVATIMMFSAVLLLGIVSLFHLPVELYPNISLNDISIVVFVRGKMPPTEIEALVTKPIEEAVSTVNHLAELLSISKEGEAQIILSFEPGTNMRYASLEVREKFARVKNKLPKEAEKPIIAQFKHTDRPITIIAVTSKKRTTESIRKIVDETIKERIKRVSGVANVEVSGGRPRKILVEIDKRKLFQHRIAIEYVVSRLQSNNVDILLGEIKESKDKFLIRSIGAFKTVDDIKKLAITTTPSGSVLRLDEIARVEDSYLEATNYARMNIRPVVSLYIQKESTANTIKVAEAIEKEIKRVIKIVPKDLEIVPTTSRATFIKNAINNLKKSLFRGIILIIIVLSLFMGQMPKRMYYAYGAVAMLAHIIMILAAKDAGPTLIYKIGLLALLGAGAFLGKKINLIFPFAFIAVITTVIVLPINLLYLFFIALLLTVLYFVNYRSILIVILSIPISLVITFGIMQACNMIFPPSILNLSINFITMAGLALGVGMLVDNSIVVFENVLKKTEEGLDKYAASLKGATEMNMVILASTFTTVIVFLPMLFEKSRLSIMYGGIAWTVIFSLTVSFFVALSVVPLMASRMSIITGDTSFLKPIYKYQKKALIWIIRKRLYILLGIIIAGLIAWFFVLPRIGQEYIGTTEQNKFTIFIELPAGAKLDVTNTIAKRVEEFLKDVPEVKTFSSRVEAWSGKVYVELVGLMFRKRSVKEVIESLRPKTDRIKPAFIYYEEEREVGTKEIFLDLFGHDYSMLKELAISMATRMNSIKGFTDTKIRMKEGRPEIRLKIDKQKAGLYDLTTRNLADTFHAEMYGLRATLFHTEASEVETITRLDEKYRKTMKDIHQLLIVKDDGSRILLDQVADFDWQEGPSEIYRKNRSRMIQVSANIGGYPLSEAAKLVKDTLREIKFPENYYYRLGGDYPLLVEQQKNTIFLLLVIVLLIYIVLASFFESFYQPVIIMATIVFAFIGVVYGLKVTNTSIGMGARIGMMILVGIVVNNGIILVDHINILRKSYKASMYKILIGAAQDRLRPVIMTSVTTIIAMIPMAFDTSEGSNLWRPLAITLISGLLTSTPLTLFLTPNIYLMFEGAKKFFIRRLKLV